MHLSSVKLLVLAVATFAYNGVTAAPIGTASDDSRPASMPLHHFKAGEHLLDDHDDHHSKLHGLQLGRTDKKDNSKRANLCLPRSPKEPLNKIHDILWRNQKRSILGKEAINRKRDHWRKNSTKSSKVGK